MLLYYSTLGRNKIVENQGGFLNNDRNRKTKRNSLRI